MTRTTWIALNFFLLALFWNTACAYKYHEYQDGINDIEDAIEEAFKEYDDDDDDDNKGDDEDDDDDDNDDDDDDDDNDGDYIPNNQVQVVSFYQWQLKCLKCQGKSGRSKKRYSYSSLCPSCSKSRYHKLFGVKTTHTPKVTGRKEKITCSSARAMVGYICGERKRV